MLEILFAIAAFQFSGKIDISTLQTSAINVISILHKYSSEEGHVDPFHGLGACGNKRHCGPTPELRLEPGLELSNCYAWHAGIRRHKHPLNGLLALIEAREIE